jgi:uncharacterized protein (DUF2267 family)
MQYDEFVGQVQHRARLASSDEAVRAIRSTLETLAERLVGNEPADLAAQLPQEIGIFLQAPFAGQGQHLTLEDFFELVSAREGVALPQAIFHAHAVIDVLGDAVPPGEMHDVRSQLPTEFHNLFDAGATGQFARRE